MSQEAEMTAERTVLPSRRVILPLERLGTIIKFNIQSFKGYIVLNTYENGTPAEMFIHSGKEGGTVHGICVVLGKLVSLGLKHGIPAETIAASLVDEAFEPSGYGRIGNGDVKVYGSLSCLVAEILVRHLGQRPKTADGSEYAVDTAATAGYAGAAQET